MQTEYDLTEVVREKVQADGACTCKALMPCGTPVTIIGRMSKVDTGADEGNVRGMVRDGPKSILGDHVIISFNRDTGTLCVQK